MDKAKELAILILKEDPNWTVEVILPLGLTILERSIL
jgi:hypothetical protein